MAGLLRVLFCAAVGDHTQQLGQMEMPNHNPLFTAGPDLTVVEGSGQYGPVQWCRDAVDGDGPLDAMGRPTHSGTQSISFVVSVLDPTLFAPGGAPRLADGCTLTFTPAPGQCGTSAVSVVLQDDGNPNCIEGIPSSGVPFVCPGACSPQDCSMSAEREFHITIACCNDPPSFNDVGDVTTPEDASRVEHTAWAYNIQKGATGPATVSVFEHSQQLTFTLTNDNTHLFSVQPSLVWDSAAPDVAALVYESRPGMCGAATVEVLLTDDGGTAYGCSDTMLPHQVFRIFIECDNDRPSFIPGPPITVYEDHWGGSGSAATAPYTYPNWASQLSSDDNVGTPEVQSLRFELTFLDHEDRNLFLQPPAISALGTLSFHLNPDANTHGEVVELYVQLTDSEGGVSCEPLTSCPVLQITVLPINDPPQAACGGDIIVCEDMMQLDAAPMPPVFAAPNWVSAVTPGPPNEGVCEGCEGQKVVFDVSTVNRDMFASGPAVSDDGTLGFELVPNANGVAVVTVRVTDTGDNTFPSSNEGPTCTLSITVLPVADKPTFDLAVLRLEATEDDLGPQSDYPGFATGISMGGGADEALTQSARFAVTADRPEMFAVQPALEFTSTTSARLSYELAPDACGNLTLDITLRDSGDVSTCQGKGEAATSTSLPMQVTCVNDPPSFDVLSNELIICEDEAVHGYTLPRFTAPLSHPYEGGEVIAFSVAADNPTLFSVPPYIDGNTLRFTTVLDATGAAVLTITATDSSVPPLSATVSTVLTVVPAVDPPDFDVSPLVSVPFCQVTYTQSCTPTDVSGCVHTFLDHVQSDDMSVAYEVAAAEGLLPDIFEELPSVSPTGTLTFTLRPGAGLREPLQLWVTGRSTGATSTCRDVEVTVKSFLLEVQDGTVPCVSCGLGGPLNVLEDSGRHVFLQYVRGVGLDVIRLEVTNRELFSSEPYVTESGDLVFTVLEDNCGTAQVVAAASCTFDINVIPVNDAPTFEGTGDVVVSEDSGATCMQWVREASVGRYEATGCDSQTLAYEVQADRPELFLAQPTISSNGTLCFHPLPEACGVTKLTIAAKDNGGRDHGGCDTSPPTLIDLRITCVNDMPSFVPGLDQVVCDTDGTVIVSDWCSGLSPGPLLNEGCPPHAQVLRFNVATNASRLFLDTPQLSPETCTLVYTPMPGAYGTAAVHVELCDDGPNTPPDVACAAVHTLLVVVNSKAANTQLGALQNVAVAEDKGHVVIDSWLVPSSGDYRFMSNWSDITNLRLQASGSLSFDVAPDAYGVAAVGVCHVAAQQPYTSEACGLVLESCSQFHLTVEPCNDAPLYEAVAAVTINNTGPVVAKAVLSHVLPGPPNEAHQHVVPSVKVSAHDATLLAQHPQLSASYDLLLSPISGAEGVINVSIVLADNGTSSALCTGVGVATTKVIVTLVSPQELPSFVPGPSLVVASGSTYNDRWAHNITMPAVFVVAADDVTLFAVQPHLDAAGTLTFTSMPSNVTVISTVAVQMYSASHEGNSATFTVTHQGMEVPDEPLQPLVVKEDSGLSCHNLGAVPDSVSTWCCADLFKVSPYLEKGQLCFELQDDSYGEGKVAVPPLGLLAVTVESVNDDPYFLSGGTIEVFEDAGSQRAAGWASFVSAGFKEDQQLVFNVTGDMSPFAEQPRVWLDGSVTFNVKSDYNGRFVLEVHLTDSGHLSYSSSMTISVLPVNDPPTFTAGQGDITIAHREHYALRGFLAELSPGPPDERGQQLSFSATTQASHRFLEQPFIGSGDLSFAVAGGNTAPETLLVTLVVRDDGGTGRGGVDSAMHTVLLRVPVDPLLLIPQIVPGPSTVVVAGGAQSFLWGQPAYKYVTVCEDVGLFRTQPYVAPDGTLVVDPSGVGGTTTCSVRTANSEGLLSEEVLVRIEVEAHELPVDVYLTVGAVEPGLDAALRQAAGGAVSITYHTVGPTCAVVVVTFPSATSATPTALGRLSTAPGVTAIFQGVPPTCASSSSRPWHVFLLAACAALVLLVALVAFVLICRGRSMTKDRMKAPNTPPPPPPPAPAPAPAPGPTVNPLDDTFGY